MSNEKFALEIISHHPQFAKKSLRKYYVDGIETVGAWGDEPFEIKFTNHTWQKIQVKLSVDGTDILTGEPASTDSNKDMWVVNGGGTLELKAWPETSNGGAHFVFTSANNSVAVHTHGDLSSRGIIAAAVYVEGHVEPIRLNPYPITPLVIKEHHHHYPPRRSYPYYDYYPVWGGSNTFDLYGGSGGTIIGGCIETTYTCNNSAAPTAANYMTTCSLDGGTTSASLNQSQAHQELNEISDGVSKSLESLAAVGAGQYVDQKINYVAGLIKPLLAETVRVRYMWWDELVAKLKETNVSSPHASGFPADKKKINIDLGSTPRIGSFKKQVFPREQAAPVYLRV